MARKQILQWGSRSGDYKILLIDDETKVLTEQN